MHQGRLPSPYVPNTDGDRQSMLEAIGVNSAAELFADMNKKLSGNEENLVAYYPMEVNNKYQLTGENNGII